MMLIAFSAIADAFSPLQDAPRFRCFSPADAYPITFLPMSLFCQHYCHVTPLA